MTYRTGITAPQDPASGAGAGLPVNQGGTSQIKQNLALSEYSAIPSYAFSGTPSQIDIVVTHGSHLGCADILPLFGVDSGGTWTPSQVAPKAIENVKTVQPARLYAGGRYVCEVVRVAVPAGATHVKVGVLANRTHSGGGANSMDIDVGEVP